MNKQEIRKALHKAFATAVIAKLNSEPLPTVEEIADAADAALAEAVERLTRKIREDARREAFASAGTTTPAKPGTRSGGPASRAGE